MSTNIEVHNFEAPQIENQAVNESAGRFRKVIGRALLAASLMVGGVTAEIAVGTDEAYAVTDNYPDKDAVDCSITYGKFSWCKNGGQFSTRGYGYRNCTDWAAWRGAQLSGASVPIDLKDAHQWNEIARDKYRLTVDQIPEVGDIAVWEQSSPTSFGHVEVVESVNSDGSVNTSGYNYFGTGQFATRSGVRAHSYVDLNGTGVGANGTSTGTTPKPGTRLGNPNDVLDATGREDIGWRVSAGGTSAWFDDYINTPRTKDTLLVGDFDHDGRVDDVMDTPGDAAIGWRVSYGGKSAWDGGYLNSARVASEVLVGDFDEDGFLDDILDTTGREDIGWRMSENGKGAWNNRFVNTPRTKETLLVGDFDKDGFIDDVLDTPGDASIGWRVSFGGHNAWDHSFLNSSRTAETLFVGDFDNDGYFNDILDVGSSEGWRVSYGGRSAWDTSYRDSSVPASDVAVGDFDNDGFIDDVFNASGSEGWRVSENGKGGWQTLRSNTRTMATLIIGDFSRQ